MSNYLVSCKVSDLKTLHTILLEQAGCRVSNEVVELDLSREQGESSDEFRNRCTRLIGRELSRLNALTGDLLIATSLKIEPPPGGITVNAVAAWHHAPQMPPSHTGWSDDGLNSGSLLGILLAIPKTQYCAL